MDWYITDEGYSHGCETHFTEKLWELSHHAHCYYADESLVGGAWAPDPMEQSGLDRSIATTKYGARRFLSGRKFLRRFHAPGYCLKIG